MTNAIASDAAAIEFLMNMLDTDGPSGFEQPTAAIWRERAQEWAQVRSDRLGNSFATVRAGEGARIALCGHVDEIGLIVTRIDDDGFLRCTNIGGWDGAVLVGQRVRIRTRSGIVRGSIGRAAVHTLGEAERKQVPQLGKMWIDIGAASGAEARELVRIGDPVVVDVSPVLLNDRRIMSRSLDDRLGSFAVLEAHRRCSGDAGGHEVVAVASVGEEIGAGGALAAAYSLQPHAVVVVEVTSPGDTPGSDVGDYGVGKGPIITRGATTNAHVVDQLIATAEAEGIPFQLRGMGVRTRTDGDHIIRAGAGVAVGLVCIPGRYLHTPCEQADLRDVEAAVQLLHAFTRRYEA